jgi:hypothetical protein
MAFSGGVAPYSIYWDVSVRTQDDVTFHCLAGHSGTAMATVTDSVGSQQAQRKVYNRVGGSLGDRCCAERRTR